MATVHQDYERSRTEYEAAIREKHQELQYLNGQAIAVKAEVDAAKAELAEIRSETTSARVLHQQIMDSLASLRKRISASAA